MDLIVFIYVSMSKWGVDYIKRRSHKRLNKTMSCKNKIAHFSGWDTSRGTNRMEPRNCRIQQRWKRTSNRCYIESTGTLTKTNNKAAWEVLAKWLKHSSKHSNKTVDKKGLACYLRGICSWNTLQMLIPRMSGHSFNGKREGRLPAVRDSWIKIKNPVKNIKIPRIRLHKWGKKNREYAKRKAANAEAGHIL